ncbi:MAG: DUF4173 domain-containing protein [Anaerolineae bacterium]
MSSPTISLRVVISGVVLGIIGCLLTFDLSLQQQTGLGFSLFGLLLIVLMIAFASAHKIQPIKRNLVTLLPLLFFTLMLCIRSSITLTTMNIAGAGTSLLLFAYFYRSGSLLNLSIIEVIIKGITSGIEVCFQPFTELLQASKWFSTQREHWRVLAPLARGILITVPVVGVFVILLSSADQVFADLVQRALQLITFQTAENLGLQIVYAGFIGWAVIGAMAVSLIERKEKRSPDMADDDDQPTLQPASAPLFSLGYTEAVMLLTSVCAVFAAFVAIQFAYLFGGGSNLDSYTYATYLHRGFVELVLVALLTLGTALTLNYATVRRTPTRVNVIRGLNTLLILLTFVILASAFQRLRLYELTYGFTSLRLLIYVFIAWLAFTFAGFIASLYWTPRSINVFTVTALIAAFGFAATLDVINPDLFVAWQNINRGNVDPLHLTTLSEEAVPALITLVDAPEAGLRSIVRSRLLQLRQQLEDQAERSDWRAFNLDRYNALMALQAVDGLEARTTLALGITDFTDLRAGMTVSEITRKFGFPYSSFGVDLYGEFSVSRNALTLTYQIGEDRFVEMSIDSQEGLQAICQRTTGGDRCEPIKLKN